MTPSHRLKLYRSDKHLEEMQALLGPLRGRREYPVVETMEPQREGPVWSYRLDLSGITPPEDFPIILGDYLFDIRSALDHLVVAIGPRKYRNVIEFPIFDEDPLARNDASGDYRNAQEAGRWANMTKGLTDDCIAALKVLQPYDASGRFGKPARHQPLSLLKNLQNADKHRELVGVVTGLNKIKLTVNGIDEHIVPMLKDGAEMVREPSKVDVKVEAEAVVGIQRGQETFGLGAFTDRLLTFLADELIPRLEPLVK